MECPWGSGPQETWGRKPRRGKASQQNGEGVSPCCPQKGRNSDWMQRSSSVCVCVCMLSHAQLFATPMDYSLPGSFVHGIFQARILEWVAISYSRGSSQSREQTCISCIFCIGRWVFLPLVPKSLQMVTAAMELKDAYSLEGKLWPT